MNQRAFSLIETIVSVSVFALLIGLVFAGFTHSSRSFQQSVLRQSLQSDLMQLNSLVTRDVRLTNFLSTQVVSRDFTKSDGTLVRRDGFSVAALSDWDDPNRFDPVTRLPLWDRHIVYYATNDADRGRLIRQVVEPAGPTGGLPYAALPTNMENDPTLNSDVISTTLISDQVEHFEVRPDDGTQAVDIVLKLRRLGGRRRGGGEERVDETLEAKLSPTARNTFPL